MTITPEELVRLRRMIAEPSQDNYTDVELTELAETAKIPDLNGLEPTDPNYIPTYDLYALAAEIWDEKASEISDEFDFSADGGSFSRSQKVQQYMAQARKYRSLSTSYTKMMKQTPTESSTYGDKPYQDWIDDYEQGLV